MSQRLQCAQARICDEYVNTSMAGFYGRIETVKISELGYVALHPGYITTNFLNSFVQLLLPPPRDVDIGSLGDEQLCRRQTKTAIATCNNGDFFLSAFPCSNPFVVQTAFRLFACETDIFFVIPGFRSLLEPTLDESFTINQYLLLGKHQFILRSE